MIEIRESPCESPYAPHPILAAIDDDSTEKRVAIRPATIQSSFLARLLQQQQDELAQAQRNIEKMLQAWGTPSEGGR